MNDVPLCPFDGKPCSRLGFCDIVYFEKGKIDEQLGRCSRFKAR